MRTKSLILIWMMTFALGKQEKIQTEKWMSHRKVQHKTMREITLLGSHDSASFLFSFDRIDFKSKRGAGLKRQNSASARG